MAAHATATSDATFNLVSVLYHTQQGASANEKYVDDAEQSGEQELVDFFRKVQDRDREIGEEAQRLLGARLHG